MRAIHWPVSFCALFVFGALFIWCINSAARVNLSAFVFVPPRFVVGSVGGFGLCATKVSKLGPPRVTRQIIKVFSPGSTLGRRVRYERAGVKPS